LTEGEEEERFIQCPLAVLTLFREDPKDYKPRLNNSSSLTALLKYGLGVRDI